jgi:WD40 repeat protein
MRTFDLPNELPPDKHAVAKIVFAADGRIVAQSGYLAQKWAFMPENFHAVEIASGRVETTAWPEQVFSHPALSADGKWTASLLHYHASPVCLRLRSLWPKQAEYSIRLAEYGDSTSWLAFSPDGRLYAAVNRDATRGRAAIATDLLCLDPEAAARAWHSPRARRRPLFQGSKERMLEDGFEVIGALDPSGRRNRVLVHAAGSGFSPDGALLAVWPEKGPALLLETATGTIVHELPWKGPETEARQRHRLALSPAGERAALWGGGQLFCQRCDGTGKPWRPRKPIAYVTDAVFHPDGQSLFVVDRKGGAYRLDAATGKVLSSWNWETELLLCVAVSPDGEVAAAGGRGGKLIAWDLDA